VMLDALAHPDIVGSRRRHCLWRRGEGHGNGSWQQAGRQSHGKV
jgi:hypothetical protein